MKLDEKGLEAAWTVYHGSTNDQRGALSDAIRAYIEAATPPDVAGLIERLEEGTNGTDITKTDPYLNALMRQAATALRLSAGGGWRPMESAPRDGAEIIYINKFGEIGFCYWSESGGPFDQSMWWDELADDECCPVAWLPRSALPASPTVEAGQKTWEKWERDQQEKDRGQ